MKNKLYVKISEYTDGKNRPTFVLYTKEMQQNPKSISPIVKKYLENAYFVCNVDDSFTLED